MSDTQHSLAKRLKYTWLHPRYLASRAMLQTMIKLAPHAHGHLLDVGCGVKPYYELFQPYITNYLGIDVPHSMHGTQSIDVGATALQLPFQDGMFDTVLSTEVMEHVPEPHQMLAEIARVLRPDGTLILTIPFHEPLHELPYDFYRYTHLGLQHLLREHGFTIRQEYQRGGPFIVVGYLLSSFIYRRFGATGYPKALQPRPIAGVIAVAICAFIQALAAWADQMIPDQFDTLGFSIVATRSTRSSTN